MLNKTVSSKRNMIQKKKYKQKKNLSLKLKLSIQTSENMSTRQCKRMK